MLIWLGEKQTNTSLFLRNAAFIGKNDDYRLVIFNTSNICNKMKIEFLCANCLHFKEQIKIIKTYKYLNKHNFLKYSLKIVCFWEKYTGWESFRPRLKLKVELKLSSSLQALTIFCYSGLDQQGSVDHFWADGTVAVQFNAQPEGALYTSCSSRYQPLQPSNCHCWDLESSQIAMATYPLMLRGSATAKHWPTDTWYSQLFFWKDKTTTKTYFKHYNNYYFMHGIYEAKHDGAARYV